jgi:hypothetical protein
MPVLASRNSSVTLIIGSALCALYPMSALVLAQGAADDAAKKAPKEHMVITAKRNLDAAACI